MLNPLIVCVDGGELVDFWRLDFLHFVRAFFLDILMVIVHHVFGLLLPLFDDLSGLAIVQLAVVVGLVLVVDVVLFVVEGALVLLFDLLWFHLFAAIVHLLLLELLLLVAILFQCFFVLGCLFWMINQVIWRLRLLFDLRLAVVDAILILVRYWNIIGLIHGGTLVFDDLLAVLLAIAVDFVHVLLILILSFIVLTVSSGVFPRGLLL